MIEVIPDLIFREYRWNIILLWTEQVCRWRETAGQTAFGASRRRTAQTSLLRLKHMSSGVWNDQTTIQSMKIIFMKSVFHFNYFIVKTLPGYWKINLWNRNSPWNYFQSITHIPSQWEIFYSFDGSHSSLQNDHQISSVELSFKTRTTCSNWHWTNKLEVLFLN